MRSFNKEWDEIHNKKVWGQYPNEDVIRFVARNFYNKDRKSCRILDFGCGDGEEIEPYTFDDIKSGIFAGRNRVHFFDKESLDNILRDCGYKNIVIDYNLSTDNVNTIEVFIAKAER